MDNLVALIMPLELLLEAEGLEEQQAMLDIMKEDWTGDEHTLVKMLRSSQALLTLIPDAEVEGSPGMPATEDKS